MKRFSSVLAVSLVACMVGDSDHPEADEDELLDLSSALLVRSRDHLQLCLQLDPLLADQAPTLLARLTDDLALLRAAHPDWQASGFDRGGVAVDLGCPGNVLIDAPIDAKGTGGVVLGPGLMATPSPYRTHIHVIADARAQTVLGEEPYVRALAELVSVDEHRVAEVSTAVVVRASSIGTDAFRMQALAESLGLQPR
jgi:hypothetical protein